MIRHQTEDTFIDVIAQGVKERIEELRPDLIAQMTIWQTYGTYYPMIVVGQGVSLPSLLNVYFHAEILTIVVAESDNCAAMSHVAYADPDMLDHIDTVVKGL